MELKFVSITKALQHLANITGKKVKIARWPMDEDHKYFDNPEDIKFDSPEDIKRDQWMKENEQIIDRKKEEILKAPFYDSQVGFKSALPEMAELESSVDTVDNDKFELLIKVGEQPNPETYDKMEEIANKYLKHISNKLAVEAELDETVFGNGWFGFSFKITHSLENLTDIAREQVEEDMTE